MGWFVAQGPAASAAFDFMAVAAIARAFATRVRVRSFIRLSGPGWEAIFLHSQMEPSRLRQVLSPLFVRLDDVARAPGPPAQSGAEGSDLVSRLERLSDLLERGALSADEFASAKLRVIAGQ